ncbi:MAG TPA: hypothetical protein VEU74_11975 [Gemmatimonadales bacterium]|nr:hypothetical protein [Gemmatimonadales bacterium]
MKTTAQIKERLAKIEADERYQSGRKTPATVFENAPLALIQLAFEAEHDALTWVLKDTG